MISVVKCNFSMEGAQVCGVLCDLFDSMSSLFRLQPTPTSRFVLSYFGAVTSAVTIAVSSDN